MPVEMFVEVAAQPRLVDVCSSKVMCMALIPKTRLALCESA